MVIPIIDVLKDYWIGKKISLYLDNNFPISLTKDPYDANDAQITNESITLTVIDVIMIYNFNFNDETFFLIFEETELTFPLKGENHY